MQHSPTRASKNRKPLKKYVFHTPPLPLNKPQINHKPQMRIPSLTPLRCAVLGAGSWGTALSLRLCANGHHVTLLDPRPYSPHAAALSLARENQRHLPGIRFPPSLAVSSDPPPALRSADLCVIAVPTPFFRSTSAAAGSYLPPHCLIISASKGLEEGTLLTMDRVLHDTRDAHRRCACFRLPCCRDCRGLRLSWRPVPLLHLGGC